MDGEDLLDALMAATSEALLVTDAAGRLFRANAAACALFGAEACAAGADVRDFLYRAACERAAADELPVAAGDAAAALAVTQDGTLVPVRARCAAAGEGALVVAVERDEEGAGLSRRARLEAELARLRGRLRGTLAVMACATLDAGTLDALSSNTADELQGVLEADASVIYLVDDYGFTPFGVSAGFESLGIEKSYLPMGTGVPTLVARNRRTTRLQLVAPPRATQDASVMVDLDADTRLRLRSMLAERCSTIVGAPVFSYDRIVAVVVVGWLSPHGVSTEDVRLLDTVADFLSVQFAAAVTQLEQRRANGFSSALATVRDLVRAAGEMGPQLAARIACEVERVVPSRILVMESAPFGATTLVRLRDEGAPARPEEAPEAARVETFEFPHGMAEVFPPGSMVVGIAPESACGMWVARHTDLLSGFGILLGGGDVADGGPHEGLLVLRGAYDRPFDDAERAFFETLAKEVDATLHAEQERAHDAEIAHALQVGLRNELPEAAGVATASLYISATESAVVGGDFFDLYELDEGRVVLVMGDVSGKGVEAAAMASLVKTALAAYAWDFLDPASMVTSLNNLFLNFSRLETFASMVVVSVDLRAGQAVYCSAGHPPAMLVHRPAAADPELELLTVQSPIVGAFEGMEYGNGAFSFEAGDVLYLYTDGTTEARDADGAFFGEDALRDTVLRVCRQGVDGIPAGVLAQIERFSGGNLHDDIAMVAARFDGLPPA